MLNILDEVEQSAPRTNRPDRKSFSCSNFSTSVRGISQIFYDSDEQRSEKIMAGIKFVLKQRGCRAERDILKRGSTHK